MAEYDGSIRINTKIDSKNASVQLRTLENRIVKTADKIAGLRSKLESLKNVKIPTEEFTAVQAQIDTTEKKINELLTRQEKFLATGGKESSSAYKKMQYDLDELRNSLPYMKSELQDLIDAGEAFTLGNPEEIAKAEKELQYAENDMSVLNQRHDELIAKQNGAANGYKKLGNTAQKSLKKISNETKNTSKSLNFMGVGFKNILKYGLGIRSLYALVNKLRNAIKEGFSNLYNDSGMGSFKGKVDELKASLLTLKNAFAAAFRPLVEIVIPYLQKVIDYLTEFINKIGQLMAAIAGQKTYTKAIKQTADAFKDAEKKAEGYLSPLDEINKFQNSEDATDSSSGVAFEEVSIDNNILDFIQKIKDSLKPVIDYATELKNIFSQGFFDGLGDWEYRWESIKESVSSIKENLTDIWTDPAVLAAADVWVQSIMYTLGSLVGSLASIGLSIGTNIVGGIAKYLEDNKDRIKDYLISMFDIQEDINYLFAELFNSIAYVFEAFASEDGQQLTANLIGIFTDAFMGLTEIISKLVRDILNIFIQPFVDNKEAFREALEGFLGVLVEATGTIKDGIDETFDKLNEVYDEHIKPFFDSIADGLSDTVGKFLEFWNNNVKPILDEWGEKFDVLWKEHIQPALNKLGELLGKVADLLKVVWENILKPVIDWLVANVLPVLLPIFEGIGDAAFSLAEAIWDVIGDIFDALGGIIDFLVGIFTGDWEKAWNGIVDTFKGIFNIIIDVVEGVVNGAIDIINGLIGGINKITVNIGIPSIPDIPKVSIPHLATGTVVPPNREFLAVLGDNKREPEVVSPLSTIEQAVRNALGDSSKEITIKVPIYLEGKQIYEAVINQGMINQMSGGSNPFMLGTV